MLTKDLMREVRRLQIRTRRRVDGLFSGEYHSAFKGQGIEFAEVREYEPGDDVRAIDWNVTARTGRPFVKRFEEERLLTVILAVDLSSSGRFATTGRMKSRLAVELAAVLSMAAARNHDQVGLMIFTDHVESFIPPRKGRGHQLRLLRDLLEFEPRGTGTNMPVALRHLAGVLHRRATIFLISDFQIPVEDPAAFDRPLRRLAAKHDVVALRVSDPREIELPKVGLLGARGPETGRRTIIDTSSARVRRAYHAQALRHHARTMQVMRSAGADLVDVSTSRPFVQDLVRYFQMKEQRR